MRTKALVLAALLVTTVARPAAANPDTGVLRCDGPVRPRVMSLSTYCRGTVTGTVSGVVEISWVFHFPGCPATASATGAMSVNGQLYAYVAYQQVGSHFDMVLTGPRTGVATGVAVITPADPLCVLPEEILSLAGTFVAV